MELEAGKIEFQNVGKLISQDSVRLAIAGSIGKLIRKLKPRSGSNWRRPCWMPASSSRAAKRSSGGRGADVRGALPV